MKQPVTHLNWRVRFKGRAFFALAFAPVYSECHSRHTFGSTSLFVSLHVPRTSCFSVPPSLSISPLGSIWDFLLARNLTFAAVTASRERPREVRHQRRGRNQRPAPRPCARHLRRSRPGIWGSCFESPLGCPRHSKLGGHPGLCLVCIPFLSSLSSHCSLCSWLAGG